MMLNGGELDGLRILKQETVNLMTRNHLPRDLLPLTFNGVAAGDLSTIRAHIGSRPYPASPQCYNCCYKQFGQSTSSNSKPRPCSWRTPEGSVHVSTG